MQNLRYNIDQLKDEIGRMSKDDEEHMRQEQEAVEQEISDIQKFGKENKEIIETMTRKSKADLQLKKGQKQEIVRELNDLKRKIKEKQSLLQK
jgi:hypothetical protein